MITDILTVKGTYILDAPKNGKLNFDIIIYKNFENRTKNTIDMGEICQNIKIAKNFEKSSPTSPPWMFPKNEGIFNFYIFLS